MDPMEQAIRMLQQPLGLECIELDIDYTLELDADSHVPGETIRFGTYYSPGNGDCCLILGNSTALFATRGGGGRSPLVYEALKFVTRAIQLDNGAKNQAKDPSASKQLRAVDRILDGVPWPQTIETHKSYSRRSDNGYGEPSGMVTVCYPGQDGFVEIDYAHGRFYSNFGDSRIWHLWNAIIILAEAIRLENEGT